MKLSQIRHVVAIAQAGSLRSAAQQLDLAQPVLTRSIRELEHELNVVLFERAARGMRLTAMGEAFIRRARAVQSELHRARDELDQLRGLTSGQVAIGLSVASSLMLLPGVLKPFRTRYPNVNLTINEGMFQPLGRQVLEGELDFYVGPVVEPPNPRELLSETLFTNQRIVLGRRGHKLYTARSLADLAGASWVNPSITVSGQPEMAMFFVEHGLPPPSIGLTTNSILGTVIIVANSDLLALLPRQWLHHPWTENSLLQQIEISEAMAAPDICLVRRAALPLTPAAEFLSDLVRRAAAGEKRRNVAPLTTQRR